MKWRRPRHCWIFNRQSIRICLLLHIEIKTNRIRIQGLLHVDAQIIVVRSVFGGGTYDGYLGDFVDNNGWGLNAIYGAAKGYPKTYFVFGGGSYKFLEFMGWGRETQVTTPIWYSAYPWSSLPQIIIKSELRVALFSKDDRDDEDIDTLLHRI